MPRHPLNHPAVKALINHAQNRGEEIAPLMKEINKLIDSENKNKNRIHVLQLFGTITLLSFMAALLSFFIFDNIPLGTVFTGLISLFGTSMWKIIKELK